MDTVIVVVPATLHYPPRPLQEGVRARGKKPLATEGKEAVRRIDVAKSLHRQAHRLHATAVQAAYHLIQHTQERELPGP